MKKWSRFVLVMFVGVFLLGSMVAQPAFAQFRDLETGSFLVFPLFDISSATGTNTTTLRITSTHPSVDVDVHVTYVCPPTSPPASPTSLSQCLESNQNFELTHRATLILDVGDPAFLPNGCKRGFAFAYAENTAPITSPNAGLQVPISFNQLIGSYQIIYAATTTNNPTPSDTTAEAGTAISIQSPQPLGTQLGLFDSAETGALYVGFGGPISGVINSSVLTESATDYIALPGYLYTDFPVLGADLNESDTVASLYRNVDTRFILLSLGITLGFQGGFNTAVTTTAQVWNELEQVRSGGSPFFWCWTTSGILTTVPSATSPAAFGSDYGNLKLNSGAGPGILGAIEEVSNLSLTGATPGVVGTTVRNLFHASSKSAPTRLITNPNQ